MALPLASRLSCSWQILGVTELLFADSLARLRGEYQPVYGNPDLRGEIEEPQCGFPILRSESLDTLLPKLSIATFYVDFELLRKLTEFLGCPLAVLDAVFRERHDDM